MASISAAITGTSSATVSSQSLLSQTRLAQARQEADQAEQTARALRSKADQADQQAQRWQNEAQYLSAQIIQAYANARAAQQSAKASNPSYTYQASTAAPRFGSQSAGQILNLAA